MPQELAVSSTADQGNELKWEGNKGSLQEAKRSKREVGGKELSL